MTVPSHPSLAHIEHRPWPLPDRPWSLRQTWANLLFLHWPIDPEVLRSHLPPELEIDTFNGSAWIGIVPFEMRGATLRGFPAPSLFCDFPEINVRTYVRHADKPGVWFLSLDVPNPLAVFLARTFFHLPYFRAPMRVEHRNGEIHYHHQRGALCFEATYAPAEPLDLPANSFGIWSTERYCLYCQSRRGQIYRVEVHHERWPLHRAEYTCRQNTFLKEWPVGVPSPEAFFAPAVDAIAFPGKPLSSLD